MLLCLKATFLTSNVFSGSYLPKNCFCPCIVKTKAIGAQHHDDIVHSHEVFWTLKSHRTQYSIQEI